MPKFRKKPIVVEAEQFFPDKFWPPASYEVENEGKENQKVFIQTLEGVLEVRPGDWIVTGIQGEKYPVKPDIFELTYDLVEE